MSRRLNLPDSAASATPSEDGRMFAPSAARNVHDIATLVASHAPATGRALELASGTGEHVVIFAHRMPGLDWQPSDIDAARRASVDAHASVAKLPNLHQAITLNATAAGWGDEHGGQDLIVLVNLLHLISTAQAKTLIAEASKALTPGGLLVLYGPFLRDGKTTSEGDTSFHASLIAQDPAIGYKDDCAVTDWILASRLELVQTVEMPANNLAFVTRRI